HTGAEAVIDGHHGPPGGIVCLGVPGYNPHPAEGGPDMPVHDWTRVRASTYHDFHNSWIIHLKEVLNGGMLPRGYYAQSEQHIDRKIADVLTFHASDPERLRNLPEPPGSVAVAEAPPQVSRTLTLTPSAKRRRRTLTVRHSSGHRIIALVEILYTTNTSTAAA